MIWQGNDISDEACYGCEVCGLDTPCNVCHEHDEPRGDCTKCPIGSDDDEEDDTVAELDFSI
jgi:hypothetical protein